MPATFKIIVDPVKTLKELDRRMQQKILRTAVNQATKPLTSKVKTAVARDTGSLKASIGRKVKIKKGRGTGVVGARSKFQRVANGKLKTPVKYAHLVELGSKHMKAQPYLSPQNLPPARADNARVYQVSNCSQSA